MRRSFVLTFVLAAGCGSVDGRQAPNERLLASGVRLSEVALYQTLKVPLMVDGRAVADRTLPIVAGRAALVRVLLTPDPEWQPRDIVVRLDLEAGGVPLAPREIRRFIEHASLESDLESGFNFEVAADEMSADLSWSVSIREVEPDIVAPGSRDGAAFPFGTMQPLGARSAGRSIKIVVVPIKYFGDGSGRLPETGDDRLSRFSDTMYKLYPIPSVQLSVREPIEWSSAVGADGSGWYSLLNRVLSARQSDGVSHDVFYYGVIAPAESLVEFCGSGCVAGLTELAAQSTDDWSRGSLGISLGGGLGADIAQSTFVHEIGHALGRQHSPCGLTNLPVDNQYPHDEARIGTWGYDGETNALIDPNGRARDMMSYCPPYWIGDYTYQGLFERLASVNAPRLLAALVRAAPVAYRTVAIDADGHAVLGDAVMLRSRPEGEPRQIELYNANGRATGSVTGYYYSYSHVAGGTVLVPEQSLPIRGFLRAPHELLRLP